MLLIITLMPLGLLPNPQHASAAVPTRIITVDGKPHAVISSLTNSAYAVIGAKAAFQDVKRHWAKEAVNDLAARLVLNGVQAAAFLPDAAITRAGFAAIMVRALGLKPVEGATAFSDVGKGDWYASAIQTAYAHGLIQGFEDGALRPTEQTTREQAMTIVAKAIAITALQADVTAVTEAFIVSFGDYGEISAWAKDSVLRAL